MDSNRSDLIFAVAEVWTRMFDFCDNMQESNAEEISSNTKKLSAELLKDVPDDFLVEFYTKRIERLKTENDAIDKVKEMMDGICFCLGRR